MFKKRRVIDTLSTNPSLSVISPWPISVDNMVVQLVVYRYSRHHNHRSPRRTTTTSCSPLLNPANSPRQLYSLDPFDVVRHSRDAQLLAELAPFPGGAISDSLHHVLTVTLGIRSLDGGQVKPVPVEPDQPRRQQFSSQAVLLGCRQRVVHEQRVSHRLVDHAIEDVREQLALSASRVS